MLSGIEVVAALVGRRDLLARPKKPSRSFALRPTAFALFWLRRKICPWASREAHALPHMTCLSAWSPKSCSLSFLKESYTTSPNMIPTIEHTRPRGVIVAHCIHLFRIYSYILLSLAEIRVRFLTRLICFFLSSFLACGIIMFFFVFACSAASVHVRVGSCSSRRVTLLRNFR